MLRHTFTTALLVALGTFPVCALAADPIDAFTEPCADIELAASEMGTLARIDVEEGDYVRAGQVIAALGDQVLRAALHVAEASMNARGALDSAQADLNTKQEELKKLQELRSRNHASQKEVDRFAGEVLMAEARVQSVREDLDVKRLECERIRAQLERRQIRSTINGYVTELQRDEGEFVSPSQPVVARVVQLDPLQIVFSIPISERSRLQKNQQVPVQIGEAGTETQARVEFVSPTADARSGTVRVKVLLPNRNGEWQSGERSVLLLDSLPQRSQVARHVK